MHIKQVLFIAAMGGALTLAGCKKEAPAAKGTTPESPPAAEAPSKVEMPETQDAPAAAPAEAEPEEAAPAADDVDTDEGSNDEGDDGEGEGESE